MSELEDTERLERLRDLLNQVLSRVATMGPKDTEQEEADKKETEEDKRLAILQATSCRNAAARRTASSAGCVPQAVQSVAKEMVNWNTDSIVSAIRRHSL